MDTPRTDLRSSPRFVAVFVAALILPQWASLGIQFARGFRPFAREPGRAALSWDMFATRVERCVLTCAPSGAAPLRAMGAPLEWDVVFDRVDDYRVAGGLLCGPGRARLRCFLPDGSRIREGGDVR